MKENVRLEKKGGKVIAYFIGTTINMGKRNIEEVKKELEEDGRPVELKE